MWCTNCQQDVPAIATPEAGKVRCTKCRRDITICTPARDNPTSPAASIAIQEEPKEYRSVESSAAEIPAWAFVERPPIDFDAWRWDTDLLEAERLLRTLGPGRAVRYERHHPPLVVTGSDSPHSLRAKRDRRSSRDVKPPISPLASVIMSFGALGLLLGAILLGWPIWMDRQPPWIVGLSLLFAGQAALILGLILQLDRVLQTNPAARIEELESDKSPADLKGQLDRLAERLARTNSGQDPNSGQDR